MVANSCALSHAVFSRSSNVTTHKLWDLINWTWRYRHRSEAASLVRFTPTTVSLAPLRMTINTNISSQWQFLWVKTSEEWERWDVEVVTFLAHGWLQASKSLQECLRAKEGSYLLLSICNRYMSHRTQEMASMFYKLRWVSAVCSWNLASYAQTMSHTGSWVWGSIFQALGCEMGYLAESNA